MRKVVFAIFALAVLAGSCSKPEMQVDEVSIPDGTPPPVNGIENGTPPPGNG